MIQGALVKGTLNREMVPWSKCAGNGHPKPGKGAMVQGALANGALVWGALVKDTPH